MDIKPDPKNFILTTPQKEERAQQVEKLLKKTCKNIAETEANVDMLTKMSKMAIATNDVRNFVVNQAKLKKRSKGLNKQIIKNSMRSKLNDACVDLHHLKQSRDRLRQKTMQIYSTEKSEGRRIIRKCNRIGKVVEMGSSNYNVF